VSREGTILRRRTEPLSLDKSTLFILIASTNSTEGKGFPTERGVPISRMGIPRKFTCPPGWDDAVSTGIFDWVVIQLRAKKGTKNHRTISIFPDIMQIPPFVP
jgi:hypothetical protein